MVDAVDKENLPPIMLMNQVHAWLKKAGAYCSLRSGSLRVAPHLYNSDEEIARFCGLLVEATREVERGLVAPLEVLVDARRRVPLLLGRLDLRDPVPAGAAAAAVGAKARHFEHVVHHVLERRPVELAELAEGLRELGHVGLGQLLEAVEVAEEGRRDLGDLLDGLVGVVVLVLLVRERALCAGKGE